MDKKEKEDLSNSVYNGSNIPNDYKFLVQKLISIRNSIKKLEKNFLDKQL